MKKLVIVLVFALSACTGKDETNTYTRFENACTMDSSKQRADFILQCIENANPKSDEEPEDWIKKCQYMAEETLCPTVTVIYMQECSRSGIFGCAAWKTSGKKTKK